MREVAPTTDANIPSPAARTQSYARYVFLIMFFINMLNFIDRYVFTGAANIIGKEMGFGIDQVGFISSAFLGVYTIATLPLGFLADRVKRKNIIACTVGAWSLATALTALAGNFTTLFLSRMALGIGEAGYYPAGTALMSDYFKQSSRARVMSMWSAGSLIGLMIGFILGGQIAGLGYGNWRWAFVLTGIPGLLLALLVWRLREPRRNQADEEARTLLEEASMRIGGEQEIPPAPALSLGVWDRVKRLFRIRTLIVLTLMQAFSFFVLVAAASFLPTYLQQTDTFGLSSGQAGILSGVVIAVAGVVGMLLGGYMADLLNRWHPGARVLICGIGFLLSAPAFAVAILSQSLSIFLIFFVITAILINMYSGPSTAATQDVVPASLRSSAVAISLLFAHLLGDAFSPAIVGILARSFDATGQHFLQNTAGHDLSLALLFTCPPALIVAGLISIFGARWMVADVNAAQAEDRQYH